MKWIKCSERLPEGEVVARHPKYGIGKLSIHAKFARFDRTSRVFYFSDEELYDFEWLDEQPIPVNQDEYWKKRCEAAERVIESYAEWDKAFDLQKHSAWQQLKSTPSPIPEK